MTASIDRADGQYLRMLRSRLENEIRLYKCEFPEGMAGNPKTEAAITAGLAQMQDCLVDPYWIPVEIRDTFRQIQGETPARRRCAVVADDRKGTFLLFDPTEDSFVLAQRSATGLVTFGVTGDAVGCFLAR